MLSAIAWSIGNVIIKKSGVKEICSFMVWASLFPPIPLFFIAWLMQGAAPFENLQSSLDLTAVLSIISRFIWPHTLPIGDGTRC